MAAAGDSEAVWNRLDVPWPACSVTVAVAVQHASVKCFSAVLKRCRAVDSFLKNRALIAEQNLLHSIIYSFHRQMSQHKPYQSIKQVEQCLKRLNRMNLERLIEEFIHLGPVKSKSENSKESLVPSQPVVEVFLVKVLGACKLLLRLLECCCTSFLLTIKHLCLQEYILLNTLILALLSRLWILYRSMLKSLSSLYKSLFELLQEVSKIQPRPYIKGFSFPSEIHEFLGIPYVEVKKKMRKAFVMKKVGTGWMNRLFSVSNTVSQPQALSGTVPTRIRKKPRDNQDTVDIGKPVLIKRTNQDLVNALEFDVRALCRNSSSAQQKNSFRIKALASERTTASAPSKSLKLSHLQSFLPKFQEVCSFEELSNTLRKTILWCQNNKLKPEAFFLRMKLLKSRRLQHVEAKGCSLKRKLSCVKATLCKYLKLASSCWRPRQRLRKSGCIAKTVKRKQETSVFLKDSRAFSLAHWPTSAQHAATETDDIDDIFKVIGL
uniref:Nucleolus and neural progenitor protein n=1 Tax=Salvator merianae TaxID=96440 RepID=A0A8D0BDY1_SALMN